MRSLAPASIRRRRVFGLDFVVNHDPEHRALIETLLAHCAGPQRECAAATHCLDTDAAGPCRSLPLVVTPNVDLLVKLDRPDAAADRETFRRAAYVVADGAPVVAVANRLGHDVGVRTPGSDLFPLLWERARAEQMPITVVCPTDIVAKGLHDEYPLARVVTAPRLDPDRTDAISVFADEVGTLSRLGAPVPLVVLAIGNPAQTRLARQLLETWPAGVDQPLVCCFGASAELHLGIVPRAPKAFQRIGMEWLYRFGREPKRLFRRYFIDDVAFLRLVVREYRLTR